MYFKTLKIALIPENAPKSRFWKVFIQILYPDEMKKKTIF